MKQIISAGFKKEDVFCDHVGITEGIERAVDFTDGENFRVYGFYFAFETLDLVSAPVDVHAEGHAGEQTDAYDRFVHFVGDFSHN